MIPANETYEQFEARCAASLGLTMEEYVQLKVWEATAGPFAKKPAPIPAPTAASQRTLQGGSTVTTHCRIATPPPTAERGTRVLPSGATVTSHRGAAAKRVAAEPQVTAVKPRNPNGVITRRRYI